MRSADPTATHLALVLLCALASCADGSAERTGTMSSGAATSPVAPAQPLGACAIPAQGCACAPGTLPMPCRPELTERLELQAGDPSMCLEGTRRCQDGVLTACEDVRAYARPAPALSALVHQTARHPNCSVCDVRCFAVIDELSPDDGPLDPRFASGVLFHDSGAGLMLHSTAFTAMTGPLTGLPAGAVGLSVEIGRSAAATHAYRYAVPRADVYVLADHSSTMAEEVLWLADRFTVGASYLDPAIVCADGQGAVDALGVYGAATCMIESVRFGAGMFRDLPFAPYALDESLPEPLREADAMAEIAFGHRASLAADSSAIATLGGFESSGNPDVAGSQVLALHALATGAGTFMGLGRPRVPSAPACASGFGYPCFREDAQSIIVLLSDAPMHNGPDSARLPYDYDPADLTMLVGTGPGATPVPPIHEAFDDAFVISGNASSELVVLTGSTASMSPDVSAATVGCGSDDDAPDAVFAFSVDAGAAPTAQVALAAAGTRFASALAVLSGPTPITEQLASAGDDNERFELAHDLGDVSGRALRIPGDTSHALLPTDMAADYQGSLVGTCGANTLAPDAVYAFDVNAASGPVELQLSADMGGNRAVLSVHEAGSESALRWPATVSPIAVSGNDDAFPANVATVPSGAGEYVTLTGSTAALVADYNASDLGGTLCNPSSLSKDAAFLIQLDDTRTVRIDTEGSSFDTVISLHDRPPLTNAGAEIRWRANTTHRNQNEDASSAYEIGVVNGLAQVFEGNTSGMRADVRDTFGCGTEDSCGDAVYRIVASERTTLRVDVSGTGFEPGVIVTRADPSGISGHNTPIATGGRHTCALSGGAPYCWGADDTGQLGDGGPLSGPDASAAVRVSGLSSILQVCAGENHTCGVARDGYVHCWGAGGQGRLGRGTAGSTSLPVSAIGIGQGQTLGPAVQVACGDAFTCALLQDGRIACFGDNTYGQVGDGTMVERRSPVLISSTEAFEQVEAGRRHVCAVRASDNAVFCWGEGTSGKLGDGATTHNTTPARVGTLTGVTHVAAGGNHTCAVLSSGRVHCWGANNVGQLGIGTTGTGAQSSPVVVRNADGSGDLANVRGGFAAGDDHTCVTTMEGFVMCWGGNGSRDLGNNSASTPVSRPTGVHNVLDALEVVSGYDHTCTLRASGILSCWGQNADLQLGNGANTIPSTPVRSQPGSGAALVNFGTGQIDAAFTQACRSIAQPPEAGCELGTYAGDRYFFCNDHARTWSGAAQACEAVGMRLVQIDEPGENAYVASQLDPGEQAWIGVVRETQDSSWVSLSDQPNFQNLDGQRVWRTERADWWFCNNCVEGYFTAAAAPDLVDSNPAWTSSSTWAARTQPNLSWGYNCVTIDSAGDWRTAPCSATEQPSRDCGFLGLRCLLSLIGDLFGGLFDWIAPWLGDATRLVFDSLAGRYASPHFSGGEDRNYACEQAEVAATTEITLDPGQYYITVKGVNDGVASNACEGAYALTLSDLGAPGGGLLACDDNGVAETTSSVIERTLPAGDYYVILKGKNPTDEGDYRLTVRDVDGVQGGEIACDTSAGASDPARVTLTAEPGRRYYAVVKGDAPLDRGAFELEVVDRALPNRERIACDAASGPSGDPQLALALPTGDYYAVLKGQAPTAAGDYQLSIGGGSPQTATFEPPSYAQARDALVDSGITVATVLSCDPAQASCADAFEQATLLAQDTGGVALLAEVAQDVPQRVVRALELVTAADRVSSALVFTPDANPGFSGVETRALHDATNRCQPSADGVSFVDCAAGATPTFEVWLHNPALAPVPLPPATHPFSAYAFTLRVTAERGGQTQVEDVPLYVRPAGSPPPNSFHYGTYFQDVEASGCDAIAEAIRETDPDRPAARLMPSWDELLTEVDVRPDTFITFSACAAGTRDELESCDEPGQMRPVLTVTAGTASGTACTAETESTACPDGYCSPYAGICQYLEGAECEIDEECPGASEERCFEGPSFARTERRRCRVTGRTANPASALDEMNLLPFLRMGVRLESMGERSRTPALFRWEARYLCVVAE